jgi:hypothetical protein
MNQWSIRDDDMLVLQGVLEHAHTILEFGPGLSTEFFVSLGKYVDTCETMPKFAQAARAYGVNVFTYTDGPDLKIEGLREQYDAAFVDGPETPRGTPVARWNSLEYALRLAPLVVLHDALRHGEAESLKRLQGLGHHVDVFRTVCGLAVIQRTGG